MSEQASEIISYSTEKRTILDYFLLVGGWFVSCISLVIVGLIAYWAIKIPEKNVNSLPIINAIRGDIRVEPAEPGGKSFDDENLSIYKNLENIPMTLEKNDIILDKSDQNFADIGKELRMNEHSTGDKKDLTLAIEDAIKKVVNNNVKENDQLEVTKSQEGLKLYLGSFDTFSQADGFKQFMKKRNDALFNANDLKIFEELEGDTKTFRVELINIMSEEEGKKLCSILSNRQFSCLLFDEQGALIN